MMTMCDRNPGERTLRADDHCRVGVMPPELLRHSWGCWYMSPSTTTIFVRRAPIQAHASGQRRPSGNSVPFQLHGTVNHWARNSRCFFSCAQTASHQSASKLQELIQEVEQFQCVYAAEPRMMSLGQLTGGAAVDGDRAAWLPIGAQEQPIFGHICK